MDVVVVRHDSGSATEFRLTGVAEVLVAAAGKAGYTFEDGHWRKQFPADTPHLDRAFDNLARLAGPMLRQSAGVLYA